jgi:hypothetical protein
MASMFCQPGRMIVPAPLSASNPEWATILTPPFAESGWPVGAYDHLIPVRSHTGETKDLDGDT